MCRYLTDLVATTHVFLKLMENMAKNKHLIVSKKTKVRAKGNKVKKSVGGGGDSGEKGDREKREDMWEAISSQLSSLLQVCRLDISTNQYQGVSSVIFTPVYFRVEVARSCLKT